MQQVQTLSALRQARKQLPEPVGFVPTMGYLHRGHLSLVELARQSCASVVASIFVNPTQFNDAGDLQSYPRSPERDLEMLRAAEVDLVWMPESQAMYPPGFQTEVRVKALSSPLEGASRPGHFAGVATVVAKLFNAVKPQRAFFGEKDAQQVRVIQRMVVDLNFELEVVVGPTVREPDGLAMSSRNSRLSESQRQAAAVLYSALKSAQQHFHDGGETVKEKVTEVLASEPQVELEYVSLADPLTLDELERPTSGALLSLAARVGPVRLIDNVTL